MAILDIARRNRRGIVCSASATTCSNRARSTSRFRRCRPSLLPPLLGNDGTEVDAVVAHGALIAERFRLADPAAVQDQRVGRARPVAPGQHAAELLLDDNRIVGL